MLTSRMRWKLSSSGMPARWTTLSTSAVASITVARSRMSALRSSSPGWAVPSGAMSSRRSAGKRPRSPLRRIVPSLPAAPVMRIRCIRGFRDKGWRSLRAYGNGPRRCRLRECRQVVVEGVLLGCWECCAAFVEPPAGEPVDAVLESELGGLNQQRDRLVRIASADLGDRQVDQQPKPWVRRAGGLERVVEECGGGRVVKAQQRLAGVAGEAGLVPQAEQPDRIARRAARQGRLGLGERSTRLATLAEERQLHSDPRSEPTVERCHVGTGLP